MKNETFYCKGHRCMLMSDGSLNGLPEDFCLFDYHGNKLVEGDTIQGYNNVKYAYDKSYLYPTAFIKVSYPNIIIVCYCREIFEFDKYGNPMIFKIKSLPKIAIA